ncbi:MAG: hypothetical protein CK547_03230 [Chitinophagaceae bacterium]|nr:MAG: hypothetical protein CK547_03230 [Chitinophagaceae bacterium]
MNKRFGIIALFLFVAHCLFSQSHFTWNDNVQKTYEQIASLRISEGRASIVVQKKADPNNLIYTLLESYADFDQLFLNEDPDDFKRLYPLFEQRIDLLKKGPKGSPFYLYNLAISHVHRAVISIRFEKNFQGAMDFRKAYVLLKENRALFPDFTPNELYFGLINTVIGTIPKGYMWLVNLFGMTGSIAEGNAMVLKYINGKSMVSTYFKSDALFMYPYLVMNFEGNEKKAFDFLAQAPYDFRKNHLHAYMAANLFLTHQSSGRALEVVNQLDQSPEYLTIPFWHYEKGYAFLNQLNYAGAQQEFALFVRSFKGKFYVKDAYEKLSWVAYLQGDMKAASFYRNEVVRKGSLITEADKLASDNASLGIWPNVLLLKARLLSDGGYQREAIRVLSGKTSNDFDSQTDRTEFVYRLARVYDLLEEGELAARYYQSAIDKGRNLPAYFASRAALQLGLLSEKKGDYTKAVGYYIECLDMEDHAFKNAMDQKALSGIQRCKKRG